jgi:quinol-cytochrome oxidoreductase complex cytochrome b subunit
MLSPKQSKIIRHSTYPVWYFLYVGLYEVGNAIGNHGLGLVLVATGGAGFVFFMTFMSETFEGGDDAYSKMVYRQKRKWFQNFKKNETYKAPDVDPHPLNQRKRFFS